MGLELPPDVRQRLLAYAELLGKWNKTYNLTAVRDASRVIGVHVLDSLAVSPFVEAAPLLDVGSGGGLPGIPLAIVMPQLPVTLVDSNSKKTAFLRQAAIELGLANVTVRTGRCEDWRGGPRFTQIVSRAFAELVDFAALTRHLLAPGGRWLAMKGVAPVDEIARLPEGVVADRVIRLDVPEVDGERHLVIMRDVEAGH